MKMWIALAAALAAVWAASASAGVRQDCVTAAVIEPARAFQLVVRNSCSTTQGYQVSFFKIPAGYAGAWPWKTKVEHPIFKNGNSSTKLTQYVTELSLGSRQTRFYSIPSVNNQPGWSPTVTVSADGYSHSVNAIYPHGRFAVAAFVSSDGTVVLHNYGSSDSPVLYYGSFCAAANHNVGPIAPGADSSYRVHVTPALLEEGFTTSVNDGANGGCNTTNKDVESTGVSRR